MFSRKATIIDEFSTVNVISKMKILSICQYKSTSQYESQKTLNLLIKTFCIILSQYESQKTWTLHAFYSIWSKWGKNHSEVQGSIKAICICEKWIEIKLLNQKWLHSIAIYCLKACKSKGSLIYSAQGWHLFCRFEP